MLGAINHVAVTVSDLGKSKEFYTPILSFLGYKNTEDFPDVSILESSSTGIAINLWQASSELITHQHHDYSPGLHHLAFNADTREEVDSFYQLLLGIKANIVNTPAEYDYAPGYYAVFFTDLDEIRIELAHIPGLKVE